ncbi:MAG TPA: Xaa-Pro peptidase family protein [Candidatus Solibacter sp.]|nr:Xaa-Pro peptidase family protein [Candidatus Solibacter sp.]
MSEAIVLFGESYHHPTIFWRTGFLAPDPVLYIEVDGAGTLFVSGLEHGRAQKQARVAKVARFDDADFRNRRSGAGEWAAFGALTAAKLREAGIDQARVEPEFPVALARAIEAEDIVVLSDRPLFEDERRAKTDAEAEAVRNSQQAAQAAIDGVREVLRSAEVRDGMLYADGEPLTSGRLIGLIDAELLARGCGADGTIAAGGSGAADPHMSDSGHLPAGMGVIIDIFPQSKTSRYYGDITRTYVVGEPTQTWQRMFDAVKEAHQKALSMVRPGAKSRDIHTAVCQTLYDAGFGASMKGFERDGVPAMIHGTGHGVGLEVHEAPRVSDVDSVLRAGDVITIEPGLYSAEEGGVRLEDTVIVTADGYRNLTDYPMDWRP